MKAILKLRYSMSLVLFLIGTGENALSKSVSICYMAECESPGFFWILEDPHS